VPIPERSPYARGQMRRELGSFGYVKAISRAHPFSAIPRGIEFLNRVLDLSLVVFRGLVDGQRNVSATHSLCVMHRTCQVDKSGAPS